MAASSRRQAIGYSAVSAMALANAGLAQAASKDQVPAPGTIPGRRCLILGPKSPLADAIEEALRAGGGRVTRLEPSGFTEAAWEAAVLNGPEMDVIVNLAIPDRDGGVGHASPAEFHRIMENSYVRTFLALKYGVQLLRKSNGGLVINVTSDDGKPGTTGAAARGAAAMGIRMMTQCAALECAAKKDKVRVNAVLVGDIVNKDSVKPGQVGLKEAASAVAFFAADAASYLTGYLLPINNGGVA